MMKSRRRASGELGAFRSRGRIVSRDKKESEATQRGAVSEQAHLNAQARREKARSQGSIAQDLPQKGPKVFDDWPGQGPDCRWSH